MAYEFVAFAAPLTTPDKAIFAGIHRVLSATDPDEWSLYDGKVVTPRPPEVNRDDLAWLIEFGYAADSYFPEDEDDEDGEDGEPE